MSADLYDILGVSEDADPDALKSAFREQARRHHPDLNPDDPRAEETFKELLAAFEILSDPEQRRLYDRGGIEAVETNHASPPRDARDRETSADGRGEGASNESGDEVGDVFTDVFDGRSPFDTSHLHDFGGFQSAFADGDDVVRSLEIDFMDAILGREVELEIEGRLVCVPIRPGTRTGDRLRLSKRGEPAPTEFGEAGDLILELVVRDHPALTREGLDLEMEVPIGIDEAVLGADIELPTPHGTVEVRVPSGVSSGAKLRLEGLGVRREDRQGDLYAVLELCTPDVVDGELEEAARRLGEGYSRSPRSDLEL